MPEFADVPEWPSNQAPPMGHNQPPLEERILLDFQEDLDRRAGDGGNSISTRVAELLASAQRAPAITDSTIAGKVGDLCKQASDVQKRIENIRESHNRPLLNAQRSLKAKADGVFGPLGDEIRKLRIGLDAYIAAENAKARKKECLAAIEAQRLRDEQDKLRREQEAAEGYGRGVDALIGSSAPPPAEIVPPKIEKPVARGDLGARVGTRTEWKHKVDSVRQLPNNVLNHPTVLEAIDKVLRQRIRGGEREIKGCTIWSEEKANIT